MTIRIQIQSVLYDNEKSGIKKTLESVANAVRVAKGNGCDLKIVLSYGDSSEKPLYTKEEVEAIAGDFAADFDFRYRFFGYNSGSAKGQNELAKGADTEYIFIMNPDVILAPNFFEHILRPFEDPIVAMVEARQIPIEHAKEYDPETFETPWTTGACTMVRTEVFWKVDYYDQESFFMYCDDVDLAWRIRMKGYKLIYQPAALVYHAKRLSSKGAWLPSQAEIYYSAQASLFMAYKWSREDLLEQKLKAYRESGREDLQEIAKDFERRRREGNLPEQLDREHRIGYFDEGRYSAHRFII
ncbi:MAG: glycosyltransferase [Lachnospiraceae bacterium]|nr:glycosyltransferase [Lachnospiraceae bacterium]